MNNEEQKCKVDGCDNTKIEARGWCKRHYARFWVHGDPLGGGQRQKKPHEKNVIIGHDRALIELTKGAFATVDLDDVEKITRYSWILSDKGYAVAQINRGTVQMHRLIFSAEKGQEVDHINSNRTDNRKQNLRFCTRSQNMMNRRKLAEKASRYKGVSIDRAKKSKWKAEIQLDKKRVVLGRFPTEEAAARAYDAKAKELFGDFACLNFSQSVS